MGEPGRVAADIEIFGDDGDLARAIAAAPGALIAFHPDPESDLARAVGISAASAGEPSGTALPLDALHLDDGTLACNLCILGTPPDRVRWWTAAPKIEIVVDGRPWFAGRATTVLVATGQFYRGLDVVPRGHPGDGRVEVQVYELRRGERPAMRARLGGGNHVPHPRIRQRSARTIAIRATRALRTEVDRRVRAPVTRLSIEVVPGAYQLLI